MAAALSPPYFHLTAAAAAATAKLTHISPHHHHFLHTTSLISDASFTHKPYRFQCCHASSQSADEEPEDIISEIFFGRNDAVISEEEDLDDEDDTESSFDLLFRFLHSLFKKVSKRAKKYSRSLLPAAISPQTVSFAVDGILLLASLSIIKALLQVICTIGGTVFAVIMLLRLIWTATSYFQSSEGSSFNDGRASYRTT